MIKIRLPDGSTINVNTDDPAVAAKAAHQHVLDNAHVQATRTAGNTFGGLLGNAINGVLPGAADAYMGVDHIVRNAANAAMGDEEFDPKNAYRKGHEFQASRELHASQDHPVQNALANVAGTVGGFFLPAAKIGTGARLASKAASIAATGGGYGALSAALRTKSGNLIDTAENAAKGLVEGATGALVAAPIVHGAGRVLAPVARRYVAPVAAAGLRLAADHSPVAADRLGALASQASHWANQDATDQANRLVDHALTREQNPATGQNWTLPQVRAEVARRQGMGVPATAADVSETARRQFASGLRTTGAGTTAVRRAIDRRQEQSGSRLSDAVRENLGPTVNVDQQAENIRRTASTRARPFYDAGYAAPAVMTEGIGNALGNQSRAMRGSINEAHELALLDGRDPNTLGFDLRPGSDEASLTRIPSWETVDLVKRGIRAHAADHIDAFGNMTDKGRRINNLAGPLVSEIRAANPHLAQAYDIYSGEIEGRDALRAGRDALKDGADDLANVTAGMTPYERQNFALGHRSAMANDLSDFGRATPYGNAAARLRTNYGDAGRPTYRALQEAHGAQNLDNLADVGLAEHEAHQTYKASRGNSQTAERAHDDAIDPLLNGLGVLATAKTAGVAPALKKALYAGLDAANVRSNDAGRAEATNILGSTDLRALDRVMSGLADSAARGRLRSAASLNRANQLASPLAGRLAGVISTYDQDYDPN